MRAGGRSFISLSITVSLFCTLPVSAQEGARNVARPTGQRPAAREEDEVVRVDTRAVFIDTLVKEKGTGLPVTGLTADNFRVLDDGRPRALTYFTREGDVRRPLALVLCLNLDYVGARRYLERDDVRASLAAALARLAPEDEVAVMAVWETIGGKPIMISDLTRDRAKSIAALGPPPGAAEASMAGRAVNVMNEATQTAIDIARRERPGSQVVFLYISDGLATNDLLEFSAREKLAAALNEANVNFSALTCDMLKGMRVATALGNIPLRILGASMTGGEQYLAKQTGGVSVKVDTPEEFGAGLRQITSEFASRYGLGFTLGENEQDAGRMHKLEVKVKARDARGRERKLSVTARRGYFLSRPKRE